jgi:hypothetical protein
MSQRHKRVFSQAVQDLFGGDGMVEDSGPLSFEDWERIVRQMQDNLSAYVGDRKKSSPNPSRWLARAHAACLGGSVGGETEARASTGRRWACGAPERGVALVLQNETGRVSPDGPLGICGVALRKDGPGYVRRGQL